MGLLGSITNNYMQTSWERNKYIYGTYYVPKLNHEETRNLNRPIMSNRIVGTLQSVSPKKVQDQWMASELNSSDLKKKEHQFFSNFYDYSQYQNQTKNQTKIN